MKKYLVWLIIFAVVEISLSLYLTVWREHFWNSISQKHQLDFIKQLLIFTGVALTCCFVSGISGYMLNLATIKWREKLDKKCHEKAIKHVENYSQRHQDDCLRYPELVLSLGYGFCKAALYIIVFSVSLSVSFSVYYLLVLVGYTIVGSIITSYIAKPLIRLNYEQQRAEATYRNNLTPSNFTDCLCLMLGIAKKSKHLTYFQQFYMQVAVIIPLILIAPAYFSSAMALGTLMRFNSLSSTILDNMGYGISSWGSINMLISCRRRLKEMNVL
jgi:putative ATP-binding cassette transporter